MKRLLLAVAATVSLSGCSLGALTQGLESPAPLQRTVIDDRAVRYAFLTLDTLATLADQALDAKLITPGTPKALLVANGLETTKRWLNAASAAQRAGSVRDYNEAFAKATEAMAGVKLALGR